ncbi:MAG TPA: phosphoadenylyl-sulfate reductase, partial [Candidatus Elarobacter sp.]
TILHNALSAYRGRIALACSFGGPSGMALLDLTLQIDPAIPVYYVDTGLLFRETYALIERVARRYGIAPIAVKPELSVEGQAERYGPALWASDPDRCCALRKVEPHRAFLRTFDAWLTGVRRTQSATRADLDPVQTDADGIYKVSPLYDWSDDDVWAYVNRRHVPVNPLHAEGYPSIGCVPCTRPVAPGQGQRDGRWAGFAKTECGIHAPAKAAG